MKSNQRSGVVRRWIRHIALALIICGSTAANAAEKWSCEMEVLKGKTYKQEWTYRMTKPKCPRREEKGAMSWRKTMRIHCWLFSDIGVT
jgi:hypothetical protein